MVDVSDLIGIKYKEHGRDKNGYDCYGLVVEVMRRLGVTLPDFEYDSHTDRFIDDSVSDVMRRFGDRIRRCDSYFEGAIILFGNEAGMNVHIGVYIGDGYFIHCNRQGVHMDDILLYKDKITGVYAWQR